MKLLFLICFSFASIFANTNSFRVNQVGYVTNGPKVVPVLFQSANTFEVVDNSGTTVFSGLLSKQAVHWSDVNEYAKIADFTVFTTPGTYRVKVSGKTSHPFVIGDDALQDAARAAMKSFYYERASTAITGTYGGKWTRSKGHSDN